MGGALAGLHAQVEHASAALWPNRPKWAAVAMGIAGIAATGADFFIARRLSRPLPADGATEALQKFYRDEIDRMRAQPGAAPVAVAVAVSGATAAPSAYLASEGADDVNGEKEGCVACGLGHLGADQGMLERGAEAAEAEGFCGSECQAWLVPAARELLALLRHDWTPARIAQTLQRAAIDAHLPEVVELKDALVTGADPAGRQVREAILGADSSIIEATRFTDSGDPIHHVSVQRRLSTAEPDLLAGERRGATALPPPLKSAVRAHRQDLLHRAKTPDDLRRVAEQAEQIDREVMAPALQGLTPADVRGLAERAAAVRRAFKAALAAAPQGTE